MTVVEMCENYGQALEVRESELKQRSRTKLSTNEKGPKLAADPYPAWGSRASLAWLPPDPCGERRVSPREEERKQDF